MQPIGVLPINKPIDVRSTQCVDTVRQILGRKNKVGHGGTLDSTASGLLILLVGNKQEIIEAAKATNAHNFIMAMPKCYETTIKFGSETTTDDASGEIKKISPWEHITDSNIDWVLHGFMGWRMQTPPSISAVHIDGERAHRLTRDGRDVEISAKPVFFQSVERTSSIDSQGCVSFRINCRKGTYIRSFARDLGRRLCSAGHVCKLKRVGCGMFSSDNAVSFDDISSMRFKELSSIILPVRSVAGSCMSYIADDYAFKRLANGQGVMLSQMQRESFPLYSSSTENVTVSSESFFSICRLSRSSGSFELMPEVNIITGDRGNGQ